MKSTITTTITPETITINGDAFPVEWSITPSRTVYAFATGQDVRIRFDRQDERYCEALAAAEQAKGNGPDSTAPMNPEQVEINISDLESIPEPEQRTAEQNADEPQNAVNPMCINCACHQRDCAGTTNTAWTGCLFKKSGSAAEQDAAEPEQTAEPEHNAKAARGPVPEKWWIGQEIKGRGWTIEANGSYERVRVVFKRKPSLAVRELVKSSGFYWSPVMKSWNRKLTHKAWRAAELLSFKLKEIAAV